IVKTTGYFRVGSKGIGFTIDASSFTPSLVVKLNGSAALYACVATQSVVRAFVSIVRSLPDVVDQSSTWRGCVVDDHVSMKYSAFGDMSIEWRPGVVVTRVRSVPSNFTRQSCRSSGDGCVEVK